MTEIPPQPGDIMRRGVQGYREQREVQGAPGLGPESGTITDPLEQELRVASRAYRQSETAVLTPGIAGVSDTVEARVQAAEGGVRRVGPVTGYEDLHYPGPGLVESGSVSVGDERKRGFSFPTINVPEVKKALKEAISHVPSLHLPRREQTPTLPAAPEPLAITDAELNVASRSLVQRMKEVNVPIINQPLWDVAKDIGISTVVGMGVKTGARLALNMAGASGMGVTVAVGAVGGAAVAGFKEIRAQRKAYGEIEYEFAVGVVSTLQDSRKQAWDEYKKLGSQIENEQDKKVKESLSDRKRHLAVFIKRQEMAGIGANTTKEVLDTFLSPVSGAGSMDVLTADEREKFFNEVQNAGIINWKRVGNKVGWGAVKGAAGALVGGVIADLVMGHFGVEAASLPEAAPRAPEIEPQVSETITIPAHSNVEDVQKIISGHVKDSLGRELLPFEAKIAEVDFSKIAEASQNSPESEIKIDATAINEFVNNTLRPETYDFQFNKPYDLGRKLSEYINMNLSYEPSTLEVEKAGELIFLDNPDLSYQLSLADSEGRAVVLKVNFHSLNEAIRDAHTEGRGLFPELIGGTEPPMAAELPFGKDVIELPAGSNPWSETEKYFIENLGRKPSVSELIEATSRVVHDSNISDSNALPPGYQLDLSSLNTYLQEVAAEKLPVSFDVESLPPVMELASGSSPWSMSEELGRVALGGEQPSAGTIAQITKALCLDNNISVPEWGIEGEIPADKIRAGSKFILGPLTKQALTGISS